MNKHIVITVLIALIIQLIFKQKNKPKLPFKIMNKYINLFYKNRNRFLGNDKKNHYDRYYIGGVILVLSLLFFWVLAFVLLELFFENIIAVSSLKSYKLFLTLIYNGVELFFCYKIINVNYFNKSALEIYRALNRNNLDEAKKILYQIAKQNVNYMDKEKIIKTTVEVLGENLCYGIVAPMFYTIFFGLPFGIMFKGSEYCFLITRNKNYQTHAFGMFPEIVFNTLSFVPTRILNYMLMIIFRVIGLNSENAYYTLKQSSMKRWIPKDSGKIFAVIAGGLDINLGGTKHYGNFSFKRDVFGKQSKETNINTEFIFRMYKLNIIISISTLVLFGAVKLLLHLLFFI